MIKKSILSNQYESYFDFENKDDISIVTVKVLRASLKVSLKFKEFSSNIVFGGAKKIIIDMTKCEFMDSSFLGAIVHLVRTARANGGDVKAVMPNHIQQYVSQVTRMDKLFNIYPDLVSAKLSFMFPEE